MVIVNCKKKKIFINRYYEIRRMFEQNANLMHSALDNTHKNNIFESSHECF